MTKNKLLSFRELRRVCVCVNGTEVFLRMERRSAGLVG